MHTEQDGVKTHHQACNLCEAICGLEIRHKDGEILSIRGDKDDPFSKGHICPKAVALQDIYTDPDRLRQPVRKTADGWQPIGWDEALDAVAERVRAIQSKHGRDAVATYLGNPTVHSIGALLFQPMFSKALGSRNRFSATSVDQLPQQLLCYLLYGHPLMVPVPDIDRTDFMLIIGANPVVSNGSMMSAPGVRKRLEAIRARGGRVVCVDPRRSETAKIADQHLFITPGSDVYLLLALLQVMHAEQRIDLQALPDYLDGAADIATLVAPYTPQSVAAITGIAAADIEDLARAFCAADSAVCYGRMGVSTQQHGALCQWLMQLINALSGNLDRPGGAMFTTPAFQLGGMRSGRGRVHFDRHRTRVRGLPEFAGEFPVAALAEEIETPGDGQIRMLITHAGNPVLSTPDSARLDAALQQLDCLVAVDCYINETTRHADIILPPVTALERDHYDAVFNALAVRNVAKYSRALFQPPAGALDEAAIYIELWRRVARGGWWSGVKNRLLARRLRAGGVQAVLDAGLKQGPYGAGGLSLNQLKQQPHGQDLGPLQPVLPDALCTANGRVNLQPDVLLQALQALPDPQAAARAEDAAPAFRLIGRRDPRSNNSWMHNAQRLIKGKDRCVAHMHPRDAEQLGLQDGDRIQVQSAVGRVQVPMHCSEDVMPGVVSIPHGWGHVFSDSELGLARSQPGVNVNCLTDPKQLDAVSGNAALNGVPVHIRAAVD